MLERVYVGTETNTLQWIYLNDNSMIIYGIGDMNTYNETLSDFLSDVENKLADISTEFSIQILKLTDNIKGHYSLSNQLERSGTSIGANIREAKYAHSRPDFIAKLQIALKECYETEYWIEIGEKAGIISEDVAKSTIHKCGSIRRMLIASVNTAKENG